jgi:hypothetical protein
MRANSLLPIVRQKLAEQERRQLEDKPDMGGFEWLLKAPDEVAQYVFSIISELLLLSLIISLLFISLFIFYY